MGALDIDVTALERVISNALDAGVEESNIKWAEAKLQEARKAP
jgi:hypothetical protein